VIKRPLPTSPITASAPTLQLLKYSGRVSDDRQPIFR
jgi:hypothetical protein